MSIFFQCFERFQSVQTELLDKFQFFFAVVQKDFDYVDKTRN